MSLGSKIVIGFTMLIHILAVGLEHIYQIP